MGGSSSKSSDYLEAVKLFTVEEKATISEIFESIAGKQMLFVKVEFEKYIVQRHLSALIQKALFDIIVGASTSHNVPKSNGISLEAFTVFLARLLRGTVTEKSIVIIKLTGATEQVSADALVQFVKDIVSCYHNGDCMKSEHPLQSWSLTCPDEDIQRMAIFLLQGLFLDKGSGKSAIDGGIVPSNKNFSADDIENWLAKSSLFMHIFNYVFNDCFPIVNRVNMAAYGLSSYIPVANDVKWSQMKTILTVPSLILLTHNLPPEFRDEYRLLFSNRIHGDSFSQLMSHITKKGPSLLIVRDKDGHIFGGFASHKWEVRPQFMGSSNCFLFSLAPHYGVFEPTGYNDHFMYLNHGVQTMPNGLGMGGQFDYFGLWINENFNDGHSKGGPRCTTYNSPQLSKDPEYKVDTIEVWGVGPPPKVEKLRGASEQTSILDKDNAAKAMLEMINRGMVSEGLREGDPTADIPEKNQLRPLGE